MSDALNSFLLFLSLQGEPGVAGPAGREGPPGKDVSVLLGVEINPLLLDEGLFYSIQDKSSHGSYSNSILL